MKHGPPTWSAAWLHTPVKDPYLESGMTGFHIIFEYERYSQFQHVLTETSTPGLFQEASQLRKYCAVCLHMDWIAH